MLRKSDEVVMEFKKEVYPLNFNFSNEMILKHWTFSEFVSELRNKKLWRLIFSEGSVSMKFEGIFKGLGFAEDVFDRTGLDGADRTLSELARGISRMRKGRYGLEKIDSDSYVRVLQEYDRHGVITPILGSLEALILLLKRDALSFQRQMTGVNPNGLFVSPLLCSYWVSKWIEGSHTLPTPEVWRLLTYDGTISGLWDQIRLAVGPVNLRLPLLKRLVMAAPLDQYPVIRALCGYQEIETRFTRYVIEYFSYHETPSALLLQDYVNVTPLTAIHVLPHYLTYHVHRFLSYDDMLRYFEWSVLRSQRESGKFTSSISYDGGVRFTRGALISGDVSRYLKFLNFLLWNSLFIDLDLNQSTDETIEMRAILQVAFEKFQKEDISQVVFADDRYTTVNILTRYVSDKRRNLNVDDPMEKALKLILDNYLSSVNSYDLITFRSQTLGRIERSFLRGLPITFSELPASNEYPVDQFRSIQFHQRNISLSPFQKLFGGKRRSLIGSINLPRVTDEEIDVDLIQVGRDIQTIRNLESIRGMYKVVNPGGINEIMQRLGDRLIRDDTVTISFWLGLLIHFSSARVLIDHVIESDDLMGVATMGLQVSLKEFTLKGPRDIIKYNGSTGKLVSVLDSVFHYFGYVEGVHLPFDDVKGYFQRCLILGSVDGGDPLATIFQQYFNSSVTQVGGLGSGNVVRAEVSQYEFSVSFDVIFSDMDFGDVTNANGIKLFVSGIIIPYMRNVEPKLAIWKINYCTRAIGQYVLNVLMEGWDGWRRYVISFVTPQFGKVLNEERYLVFILLPTIENVDRYLEYVRDDALYVDDQVPLVLNEWQCASISDCHALRIPNFPRAYFFSLCGAGEIEGVLTLLSHRCRSVTVVRNFGGDSVICFGTLNLARVKLCSRVDRYLEMSRTLLRRFDVQSFGPSLYEYRRGCTLLSIGNFWRELSRFSILTSLHDLNVLRDFKRFLDLEDEYHYVGIGDERARNIIVVPIHSPYTIYDLKKHDVISEFRVTCIEETFPLLDYDAMKLVVQAEYARHGRKLVLLLTYMLFNAYHHRDDLLQIILNLVNLVADFPDLIHKIYFNTYLLSTELKWVRSIPLDFICTVFDDIYVRRTMRDDIPVYQGTFTRNYDFVDLLTFQEINDIAMEREVHVSVLPFTKEHLRLLTWVNNLTLSSFDYSGLDVASTFIPIIEFSVGPT